jgi:hypothetical protein
MKASNLRVKYLLLKKKKPTFWLRLLRLRDKYCFGSVRFSSKERCKRLLTPTLVKPKLWPWK